MMQDISLKHTQNIFIYIYIYTPTTIYNTIHEHTLIFFRIHYSNCFLYASLGFRPLLDFTAEIPPTYNNPITDNLLSYITLVMCEFPSFNVYIIEGIILASGKCPAEKKKQSLSSAESLMVRMIMPEIMTDLVAFCHSEDICHLSENCQVCHEREFIMPLSMAL